MYCKYSRDGMEMTCILQRRFPDIRSCWNIEDSMKNCKHFVEVEKKKWDDIQKKSDKEFLKAEGII